MEINNKSLNHIELLSCWSHDGRVAGVGGVTRLGVCRRDARVLDPKMSGKELIVVDLVKVTFHVDVSGVYVSHDLCIVHSSSVNVSSVRTTEYRPHGRPE